MVSRIEWNERFPEKRSIPDSKQVRKLEHLLKVVTTLQKDADSAWALIWSEFKPLVTGNGLVSTEPEGGFTPACGWPELLERLWALKRHLDCAARVCSQE